MDPVIIAGGLAVAFALVALLLWRRAADLEEQVRALEAKLADRPAPPAEAAEARSEPDDAHEASAEAGAAADEADEDEADEDERAEAEEAEADSDDDDDEDEPAAREDDEGDEAGDDRAEEPSDEAEEDSAAAAPAEEAAPAQTVTPEAAPPKAAAPDPMRLEALKIVTEAFELARYLDFDAIVEKPSTYRVTVPITAANGNAVRYLEDGMFTCLSQVRIEDDSAVLHIDTGKGPP